MRGGLLCPSVLVFITVFHISVGVKVGGKVYDQKTAKFGPQAGNYEVKAFSALAVPVEACSPIEESLEGKIALVKRGGVNCYFLDKVNNAQEAGAKGVIVGAVDKNTKLLTMFAKDNSPHEIRIPAVFVEYDAFEILTELEGEEVTLDGEGEQVMYDPLHWQFAKNFLVVLPIIFLTACCCWMILKSVKNVLCAYRRTEHSRRLPTIKFKPGEIHNNNCCICIEDFETNESTKVLPCGHGYHPACIDEWLQGHSDKCPMCKRSIFSEPTHPLGSLTRYERIKECCTDLYCCNAIMNRSATPGPRLLSMSNEQNLQAV